MPEAVVAATYTGELADEVSRREWFLKHARGLYAYDSTLDPYTNIYMDKGAKLVMTGIAEAVLNGAGWGSDEPPNGKGRGLPWDHTDSLFKTFQVWHAHREWCEDTGSYKSIPNKIVYRLTRDDRYCFAFQRYVLRREVELKDAVERWHYVRNNESADKWYPYPGIDKERTYDFMMLYDYRKYTSELPEDERMGYVFSMNGGLIYHDSHGWGTHT